MQDVYHFSFAITDDAGVISGIDPVPFEKGRGCRGYKKANETKAIEAGKITAW